MLCSMEHIVSQTQHVVSFWCWVKRQGLWTERSVVAACQGRRCSPRIDKGTEHSKSIQLSGISLRSERCALTTIFRHFGKLAAIFAAWANVFCVTTEEC